MEPIVWYFIECSLGRGGVLLVFITENTAKVQMFRRSQRHEDKRRCLLHLRIRISWEQGASSENLNSFVGLVSENYWLGLAVYPCRWISSRIMNDINLCMKGVYIDGVKSGQKDFYASVSNENLKS